MEEEDLSAFAFTYRNKMTGELGHPKNEGYEFWQASRGQCILTFPLTHEGERSLALMTKVTYKDNIDLFLLEMENHNSDVGRSGVAGRQMVARHIPKDALRRLSTEEYTTDSAWITALRTVCRREEIFVEQLAFSTVAPVVPETTQVGKGRENKRLSQNLGNKESNTWPKKKLPTK